MSHATEAATRHAVVVVVRPQLESARERTSSVSRLRSCSFVPWAVLSAAGAVDRSEDLRTDDDGPGAGR
jgi:hypothetical protein